MKKLLQLSAGLLLAFACAAQTPVNLAISNAQLASLTTVVQSGTTGTTQYCYWVVVNYTGGKSNPSGPLCTYTSNATLSSTNFNTVSFLAPTNPLSAVSTYDLLRTTTTTPPASNCACAVSTAQAGSPLVDNSNSLSAYNVTFLPQVNVDIVGDNVTTSGLTSARERVNGTTVMVVNATNGATFAGGVGQAAAGTAFTAFSTPPIFLVADITDTTDSSGKIWYSQIYIPNSVTLTGECVLTGTATTDSFTMGLYGAGGGLLANSNLAGATLTTASAFSCQAFTGTIAVKGPAWYFVAIQGNGATAASFYAYGAAGPTGFVTGSQAGTFGTLATISSPATSYTASVGPVMFVY
jgi:hypothetical protein